MFSFFKSKKVLGLDIGTSMIKVAEMDGNTLSNFGFMPTPSNVVAGGEITDTVSLTQVVQKLLSDLKSKRKNIVTGIWGSAVITKKITLPKMDPQLVGEQIRWEAEQYIPFDINEINLDYHVFKKPHPNPEMMDVLIVAAKRDYVFKFAEVIEASNKSCAVLDVSNFALANCFFANYGEDIETSAILNIGAGVTSFVVIEQGEVLFSRDVPVGGLSYTSEIGRHLGVSLEEAENLKLSTSNSQEVPQEVQNVIQSTHDSVGEEIRRTFDFYTATGNENPVRRIFYTGGASLTSGLVQSLNSLLQITLEPMNPFQKIKPNSSKISSEHIPYMTNIAAVSMGLGMRRLE